MRLFLLNECNMQHHFHFLCVPIVLLNSFLYCETVHSQSARHDLNLNLNLSISVDNRQPIDSSLSSLSLK